MADQGVALDPAVERQLVEPFLGDLQRRLAGGRRPLLLLNGPVGAGKSTLAGALQRRAAARGLALAVASIDDLYLPWPERRRQLEGNPFAVTRVPPGSHDVALLCSALEAWRGGEVLRLPRFDKTLAQGQGDRSGWREQRADALLLEGWLLGCRPLGAAALAQLEPASLGLSAAELAWLPRWDRELAAWEPLLEQADGLWLLRPRHWGLPRRWRFQAEARQRRTGGGWLAPGPLDALVRASLCSLPPTLYQDPLAGPAGVVSGGAASRVAGGEGSAEPIKTGEDPADLPLGAPPLLGMVELDGRRRVQRSWLREPQPSPSSASSAIG